MRANDQASDSPLGDVLKTAERFELGQVIATPAARELLDGAGIDPGSLLRRHQSGDYGDLPGSDRERNDIAIGTSHRISSRYSVAGELIWLVTEADRSLTTFCLPVEL